MMMPLLLFAAQSMSQADALNAAFTQCLFAAAREAHARGQSTDGFRNELAQSCRVEESALRQASVALLMSRGESRPAAGKEIDETLRGARANVVRAYSFSAAGQ